MNARIPPRRLDVLHPVPFDPKSVFGKVRAPVSVTVNGYTYQSAIATISGVTGIRAAVVQQ